MGYITHDEKREYEGFLWNNKIFIEIGVIFGFILMIVLYGVVPESIQGGLINGAMILFFAVIGFPIYLIFYRNSPRTAENDGIEIKFEDNYDPSRFRTIFDFLSNNGHVDEDFEPFENIVLNLSTKYYKKFERKSAIPVHKGKDALKALKSNNIIANKDKNVKKTKIRFFYKDLAVEDEVKNRAKRGNL